MIWILLFTTSTAAALVIRCAWILRRKRFGSAAVFEQLMSLLKAGGWDLERTDRAKIIDLLIETIVFDSAKGTLKINYRYRTQTIPNFNALCRHDFS